MAQETWSGDRYRKEMGLAPGVIVPAKPTVRKSIGAMNKTEAQYANYLEHEKLAGHIVAWWPQPFALKLPGWRQTYKPDFLVQYAPNATGWLPPNYLQIVEIKAMWRNGKIGFRPDAREKFKTAAGIYTCFAWVVKWRDEHWVWCEERFE